LFGALVIEIPPKMFAKYFLNVIIQAAHLTWLPSPPQLGCFEKKAGPDHGYAGTRYVAGRDRDSASLFQ